MKEQLWLVVGGILLCGFVSAGKAAELSTIKAYGVYATQGGDYVRVKSFKHWDVFYRHFAEIPVIPPGDKPLELLVYQKDLDTNRMEFVSHPFDVPARNNRLSPVVTPVDGKKDMVRVSFEEKPDPASLLDVALYWGSSFRGMVALSDPKEQLLRIYSDEDQNAVGVLDSLQDILKAYPGNVQFQALVDKWTVIAKVQKDDGDFKYVTDAWDKYKKADKPGSKLHWLKKARQEINGYKRSHPKGKHLKEADAMAKEIDRKLEL
ncbi:MAG: hypothetical protein OEZ68_02725 [Gammaproteobacteria bacterium]|nr:hypothetical protein [Gammaproteobacteria bacterium]MDH5799695.1 hypothetical protein [Gammaproteobacteria bacterium]